MTEFTTTMALRADDHPVSCAATPPREGNTTPATSRPRYRLVRFWPPRQPARRGFEPAPKRAMDIEASLK